MVQCGRISHSNLISSESYIVEIQILLFKVKITLVNSSMSYLLGREI